MAERIIPQAINYYSQWAIANASFADITDSTEELATTFSKFMSYVGWGVLLSPVVAGQIVTMSGNVMSSFATSIFFNVCLIVVIIFGVEETLPAAERKPFSFRWVVHTVQL